MSTSAANSKLVPHVFHYLNLGLGFEDEVDFLSCLRKTVKISQTECIENGRWGGSQAMLSYDGWDLVYLSEH